jgi:hypothetical protein
MLCGLTVPYDIFFSYRRGDLERAKPLLDALIKAGIRVWRDETEIPDHASITAEIRNAIADSKALLAFYSDTYPLSNPCQEEIITAWLAAEQLGNDAHRRVWIVNPEQDFIHIPELLRDQQCPQFSADNAGLLALSQRLKDRLAALGTTLGDGHTPGPKFYGMQPVGAKRFVGRVRELWDLHGKLIANRIGIITGVYGQTAAQVRGLGGNGKSLLAREYGIRFGRAYPGGVFWLNAYGYDETKGSPDAQARKALRQDQIREFASELNLAMEGLKPEQIEAAFWRAIEQRGQYCLWIVDDLPSGLTLAEIERDWHARWIEASTLITTRSREYGSQGDFLDLDVLAPTEAYNLLVLHRPPKSPAEEAAAHKIVKALGYHPLAVDVAGGYLGQGLQGFEEYLKELESDDKDAEELGAVLKESLPTGHERSIGATLLKSVRQIGSEGFDFLRLASEMAVAPIPVKFLAEVFDLTEPGGAGRDRALKAIDQAGSLSLCEKAGDDARAIHTLVSRVVRRRFNADERTRQLRSAAVETLAQRFKVAGDIREHAKLALDLPHARHIVASGLQTVQETLLAASVARYDYERADYPGARELQEQVIAVLRRLLGEEHPHTLTAIGNLAGTLHAQGELTGARELQEQVLAARRRVLGEEHPDTLTAMGNLAGTLYAQGDLAGARKLEEEVLTASRRLLGEAHPVTLTAKKNLARMRKA